MSLLLRYPGGKSYAKKHIIPALYPRHRVYAEAFCGGASIFLSKRKSPHTILNDIDPELINCFLQIRDNSQSLVSLLADIQANQETYRFLRHTFQPRSDLERALRYFCVNRLSFNGIMSHHGGYSLSSRSKQPHQWPQLILESTQKLHGVEITQSDFEPFLETLVPDGALVYCDPVYWGADPRLYRHSFTKEDHQRLATVLKRNNGRLHFLITYDDVPAIWQLYQDWTCITRKQWVYQAPRADYTNGRRRYGRELLITNYPQIPVVQQMLPLETFV